MDQTGLTFYLPAGAQPDWDAALSYAKDLDALGKAAAEGYDPDFGALADKHGSAPSDTYDAEDASAATDLPWFREVAEALLAGNAVAANGETWGQSFQVEGSRVLQTFPNTGADATVERVLDSGVLHAAGFRTAQ